ncbi:hemerythrin domain-containing protein [Streptomyces sedi]|uniref:Hemerythrin domain-containing protein n=2 Tax=Streptomyces sedi TaxID=555059 RepID=A0A5C4VCZ6_9ACTN|nr:hemerythrin domain-containing protein [Streptomyces sedi]
MQAESHAQALTETRLAHETHRLATGLLVDAAGRTTVPRQALARLRDFIVANLRHHHETEDAWLWPLVVAAAPDTKGALDELSEEHDRLDSALDRLAAVDLTGTEEPGGEPTGGESVSGEGTGGESVSGDRRHALREAAVAVRDSVRDHLTHEEPVLFPALRHITPTQWEEFAQRVIASTPPVAGHLMIGFLDEAGTPAEVESMLVHMPAPAKAALPALRGQAAAELRALRGDGS